MTAGFDAAWAAVEGVDGWLTEGQARALFDAAAACPSGGRIVEIGSYQGRSTIVLAMAAPPDVEVIAIDPHAGTDRGPQEIEGYADDAATDRERFTANLRRAGVAERVVHVPAFSDRALAQVTGTVDVLYVDGAHRYGPARADLHDWGARVVDGGLMLIHDSFSSIGVTAAIGRELVWSDRFTYVGRTRSLATYRACAPRSRIANAARQLAQLPWFGRNLALKVALAGGLGRAARRLGRAAPDWPY